MLAIKAQFDGEKILLPKDVAEMAPGEVIVIFESEQGHGEEAGAWMRIQQDAFARAWDNPEDAAYDLL